MLYNIYFTSYQKKDTLLNNIIRKFNMYKNINKLFIKYGIYGATILKTIGFYEGAKENSYLMQVITDKSKDEVINFCKELRSINNQDSILLQITSENILIYADKIENI